MLSSIRSEPTLSRLAGMGWVSPDRRFIPSGWRQSGSYSVMPEKSCGKLLASAWKPQRSKTFVSVHKFPFREVSPGCAERRIR